MDITKEYINLVDESKVVNIASNSTNETEARLSNLSYSPFVMDWRKYTSVEAFWQWLKFEDEETRLEIAEMFWYKSKYWINFDKASKSKTFVYELVSYIVWSEEHHWLMKRAIRCKLEQNPEILKLLLETWNKKIIHCPTRKDWTPYPDSTTIPAEVFSRIYMELREEFRNQLNEAIKNVSKKANEIF